MKIDVDGFKTRTFVYIVKGLNYPLILRKPWIKYYDVIYVTRKHLLTVGVMGHIKVYEKGYEP